MVNENIQEGVKSTIEWDELEEFIRTQIQKMLQDILDEEAEVFLGRKKHERKGPDSKVGYRNGYAPPRRVGLMNGTVKVRRPKVRGAEERFESRLIPRFRRFSYKVGELLPELYLHGLSTGDFELALRGLLGEGAPLSASSIQRLKVKWQDEYEEWNRRSLEDLDLVYLWADGVYVKAGLEKEKAALLVLIGATTDGRKVIIGVTAGFRESVESWSELLRSLKRRGLRCPRLTIADGHLGIWGALSSVYPGSREQRCWAHKIRNVMSYLPNKLNEEALEILKAMPYENTRRRCCSLRDAFKRRFDKRYPAAVKALYRDWERMVAFYDFPREHWRHIRTTNIVESPFAAVRLRTSAAKRFKKVANATAVIWKILRLQENVFHKLNAWRKLRDVYNDVIYVNGTKKRIRSAA